MNSFRSLFFIVIATGICSSLFLFAGCAKEETTKIETATNSSSQTTIAADEVTLNNEFDQVADDALAVICNHATTIPGTYIDTSKADKGTILILYTGVVEPDGTKTRSGSDSIHLPMVGNQVVPWGTPGATASITFASSLALPGYEITYTANSPNTSLRFNGTATLTNISGGYLQNVSGTDSLIEIMRGVSVEYTFDDQAATITYYPFNLNQERYFTKSGTILYATSLGDTTISGFTNVADWGTNRYGKIYFTSITGKVVQNISNTSLSYNPLVGEKEIQNIEEPILCTYGVNSQGNVITSGTPYGLFITWVNNGGQAQAVVPYYY